MWRLKTAEGGNDPYLYSTNNYVGRRIWKFDPDAGSLEERAQVEEFRQNFYKNRYQVKPSGDLLWRMQFIVTCGGGVLLLMRHNDKGEKGPRPFKVYSRRAKGQGKGSGISLLAAHAELSDGKNKREKDTWLEVVITEELVPEFKGGSRGNEVSLGY
ncbi:hypothetical protein GH714_010360 [Hevea brasiliensis]|uniref:Squalene cyclase N-terminal domain-containing protein n=1 Tax=Hevea brasiliensis TaxID=3981 RepID=A0A6A6KZA1_HEVBR|nr:hypothetical protein GH714_010360 [Hevea brasiliensis]